MATISSATHDANGVPLTRGHKKVIFASSLGTVFEWYDFYLYGSLAAIIAAQFFSGVNETTGFIFALLAFAAGFAVRPFGAIVFGRLGDMIGRKYTFLVTVTGTAIETWRFANFGTTSSSIATIQGAKMDGMAACRACSFIAALWPKKALKKSLRSAD